MITFQQKGDFKKTTDFFNKAKRRQYMSVLDRYGNEGVRALASATPVGSGKTAASWKYDIRSYRTGFKIVWTNSNIVNGVPIAVILQYGHATRNGGYVMGIDYVNPTMKPILDSIANDAWKEIKRL